MDGKVYPAINKEIEARRRRLGLRDIDVAYNARLSIHEYGDLEQYSHELFDVVPLYHVKKVLRNLEFDWFKLFDLRCVFCDEGAADDEDYWLRRSVLVQKRRNSLGLSRDELGDRIGFEAWEIERVEMYTAHLESWVIENILKLASEIAVPPQMLLDVQCLKCGR